MATEGKKKARSGKEDVSVAYHVEVDVDINGNFKYTADGADASTLRLKNNDTISWSVKLMGLPVPFQVEFGVFGPFDTGVTVLRSMFQTTPPVTVSVPPFYHGNLVFKYTVGIANGWWDDPVVLPVPSDGLENEGAQGAHLIDLSIANNNLVVASANAAFAPGAVTWEWAEGSPYADDFTVTFTNPPMGWPTQPTSQNQLLVLNLQTPAGPIAYSLQTLNLGLSAAGLNLTIQ